MINHLTLVTQAPASLEPLFPLLQAGAPWAVAGLMAATLVQPVTDALKSGAEAVSAGAKRSFAAAQVPVRATQAHFDRLMLAMRGGDDGQ